MNARDVLRRGMETTARVWRNYLADMNDSELLVRPVPGANHIAWQLGHLIKSEHQLMEMAVPGSMPPLPEGFAERYTKDTAALDAATAFHTKKELLDAFDQQRAATLKALEQVTEEDLDRPVPGPPNAPWQNVADVFLVQSMHYFMHAGQWVVTRRKLGRPPLF